MECTNNSGKLAQKLHPPAELITKKKSKAQLNKYQIQSAHLILIEFSAVFHAFR